MCFFVSVCKSKEYQGKGLNIVIYLAKPNMWPADLVLFRVWMCRLVFVSHSRPSRRFSASKTSGVRRLSAFIFMWLFCRHSGALVPFEFQKHKLFIFMHLETFLFIFWCTHEGIYYPKYLQSKWPQAEPCTVIVNTLTLKRACTHERSVTVHMMSGPVLLAQLGEHQ